ncbi:MAG: type III pantothenate kinase [Nitrospirae bacterium]|nr:type III pantothenate kinase [Nitrospirota bacterium]
MLLAIDIGNSSITMGILCEAGLLRRASVLIGPGDSRDFSRKELTGFLLRERDEKPWDGVIISSVVPGLTETVAGEVRALGGVAPVIADVSLDTGLTFDVERPREIGTDRVAAVMAAREIYGSPVLVADFGTATSVSVVRNGGFIGGAILPGLRLMAEALHRGAAKLPYVGTGPDFRETAVKSKALGKNTTASIISGMIYGTAGAVEKIARSIEFEQGCSFRVVITGGFADMMTPFIERDHSFDPDLVLKGLHFLYKRNFRCTN